MTLYEFNLLEGEEEKLAAILINGECTANRKQDNREIMLYQLCSFYVEVLAGDQTKNKVLEFRSFSSLETLKPYLEEIDISEINGH